eukprot:1161183-Pelagomonas_calceolata.AAC.4
MTRVAKQHVRARIEGVQQRSVIAAGSDERAGDKGPGWSFFATKDCRQHGTSGAKQHGTAARASEGEEMQLLRYGNPRGLSWRA